MGTWGCGILQNDTVQDNLCEVIGGLAVDSAPFGQKPATEANASRLGAGVGLLLQLSAGPRFDPEHRHWPRLRTALKKQRPAFASLPPEAARLPSTRARDRRWPLALPRPIEPCRVDPDRFASWRARFRAVQVEMGEPDPDEADFLRDYNACLELALQIGIDKFSRP
jgi:hypothetical protein